MKLLSTRNSSRQSATDDENAAQEQADKLAEMQKQIEALTADKENLVKEKTLTSYREKVRCTGL